MRTVFCFLFIVTAFSAQAQDSTEEKKHSLYFSTEYQHIQYTPEISAASTFFKLSYAYKIEDGPSLLAHGGLSMYPDVVAGELGAGIVFSHILNLYSELSFRALLYDTLIYQLYSDVTSEHEWGFYQLSNKMWFGEENTWQLSNLFRIYIPSGYVEGRYIFLTSNIAGMSNEVNAGVIYKLIPEFGVICGGSLILPVNENYVLFNDFGFNGTWTAKIGVQFDYGIPISYEALYTSTQLKTAFNHLINISLKF